MKHEKVFLLTDMCGWEANKKDDTSYPHRIGVADLETGAIRYIKSGAKISLVEGEISAPFSQEVYNKMSSDGQSVPKRTRSKGTSKTKGNTSV